jgi:aldehyde dehydrogenase (NAD+)
MTDQLAEPRMLIDGMLVEAGSGVTFANIDPATEERLGETSDAGEDDMATAIGAARRAFDETSWSTEPALRTRCLDQLQVALEEERELFRKVLVAEAGAPLLATYGPQLDMPLHDALRYPRGLIDDFAWERELPDVDGLMGKGRRHVLKEPIGVVGAIIPWNFPLEITLNKLGPALAAGNTVVVKPAPDTPWNATHLGRLIAEQTDIPPGVVNVVPSSDHARGQQIVEDPRVDLISFTGSTAVGRRIMSAGGPTLKRLFLELGGKSASIILDDADFSAVLPGTAFICFHSGQGCAIPTRLLLPRSRYDEGLEIVAEAFAGVRYGDPNDPGVIAGPLVNATQRERVLGYIQSGIDEGARLVCGGGRPAQFDRGYFVEPTLFADVDNRMRIAQEEIFGPVLSVIPYGDDDDAVRIANDSAYGLSGIVSAGSDERALAVAKRLRTGTVSVNGGIWYAPDSPFGGYKASGVGRQGGLEGLEQYLETKTLAVPVPG